MQGGTGVVLKITITAVLTAIVNLLDVKFPAQQKTLADMTAHPTSGSTVYKALVDSGFRELTPFTAILGWESTAATHAAVLAALSLQTATGMSIEDPNADDVITFDAYVSKILRISPMKDGYKAEVEITPTGTPTVA